MAITTITKSVGGDRTHQLLAYTYMKQGMSPVDAMDTLRASGYKVAMDGCTYKV